MTELGVNPDSIGLEPGFVLTQPFPSLHVFKLAVP
jgi:hypothetical protein